MSASIRPEWCAGVEANLVCVGLDRFLAPTRTFKAFVQGPPEGITATTPLVVLVHGLGGRQNDIAYKRLRRELSRVHGAIAVGVNVIGSEAMVVDAHYAGYLCPMVRQRLNGFADEIRAARQRGDAERLFPRATSGEYLALPPDYWFCSNAEARRQLTLAEPTDYWDYGVLQAFDVMITIDQVLGQLRTLGLDTRRLPIHLAAQSAGSQVALMCRKFAPQSFTSILDVGGLYFAKGHEEQLGALLTNPFGHLASGQCAFNRVEMDASISCRVFGARPVPFPTSVPTPRTLADEIELRLIDHELHQESGTCRLLALAGSQDMRMPLTARTQVLNQLRAQGLEVDLRLICPEQVDGRVFSTCEHALTNDFPALWAAYGPELLAAGETVDRDMDLGSGTHRTFSTATGTWTVHHVSPPQLSFQSRTTMS